MAAAERHRRDDQIQKSNDVVDDPPGEVSNDSDDSSGRARYISATPSYIKFHLIAAMELKGEVITTSDQQEY